MVLKSLYKTGNENPNDLKASDPDEAQDLVNQFAQDSLHKEHDERTKDGQVYKILHDVKMEGEDPIADDNYYKGKDGAQHHEQHQQQEHKTQSVHMRQHEYDVVNQSHDRDVNEHYDNHHHGDKEEHSDYHDAEDETSKQGEGKILTLILSYPLKKS